MKFLIIVGTLIFSSAAYAESLVCTVTRNPAGEESIVIAKEVVPFENGEASLSTDYPEPDARSYFASANEGVVRLNVWLTEDFGDGAVSVEEQGRASLRLWFQTGTIDISCSIE
jgi:hypothetical protein